MREKLEEICKKFIEQGKYKECEEKISEAMKKNSHSAIPHNLMGVLMEREGNHVLAMKHFRAAYSLDPTYIPARYNMDLFGNIDLFDSDFLRYKRCAYKEEDCPVEKDSQFDIVYDEHNVACFIRK